MDLKLVIPDKKYLSSVKDAIEEYRAAPSEFEKRIWLHTLE